MSKVHLISLIGVCGKQHFVTKNLLPTFHKEGSSFVDVMSLFIYKTFVITTDINIIFIIIIIITPDV